MAIVTTDSKHYTDIAEAIRAKGVSGSFTPSQMASAIEQIEGGGGAITEKEVNFYDYDGTLVAGYTLAEAQALSELPTPPTHDGLTFQEWNWTLAEVNALNKQMNIGAIYETTSGATLLRLDLSDYDNEPEITIYFSQTVSGGVMIDWGDGTSPETVSGTGNLNKAHTYQNAGQYTIALYVANECLLGLGNGTFMTTILGYNERSNTSCLVEINLGLRTKFNSACFDYCWNLTRITLPKDVVLSNVSQTSPFQNASIKAFHYLRSMTAMPAIMRNNTTLEVVTFPPTVTKLGNPCFYVTNRVRKFTIPDSVITSDGYFCGSNYSVEEIVHSNSITKINSNDFQGCRRLKKINIPDTCTNFAGSFVNCTSLQSIRIPDGVTSLPSRFVDGCASMQQITIPSTVTTIANEAFARCYGMRKIIFKSSTPPTVANSNAFVALPTNCEIHIPLGSLTAYTTATNYPSSATYNYVEDTI